MKQCVCVCRFIITSVWKLISGEKGSQLGACSEPPCAVRARGSPFVESILAQGRTDEFKFANQYNVFNLFLKNNRNQGGWTQKEVPNFSSWAESPREEIAKVGLCHWSFGPNQVGEVKSGLGQMKSWVFVSFFYIYITTLYIDILYLLYLCIMLSILFSLHTAFI